MSAEQKPNNQFSVEALKKNPKFMTTIQTFVLYGTIMYVVDSIISMLLAALSFARYYVGFNVFALIMAIIAGVIGTAIGGVVFYFIYEPVKNWVKKTPFLAKYINSMFSLFWKPYLVIIAIKALVGLLGVLSFASVAVSAAAVYQSASFSTFFVGWIITLAVEIGVYYWFAKNISKKLEPLYPW